MSANTLFISPELIKSRTGISVSIDDKNINPQIKVAQDMYIQPSLGSTLYKRLQDGITATDLSADEKVLLNTYVTDCLVWYTVSLLPFALGYQFFSKGVLQKTSEESNTPSRADLELISNQYKGTAEFYKKRMVDFLKQNYSLYNEYLNTGAGFDVIFPEQKAYTCPIYLGDAYDYSKPGISNGGSVTSMSNKIKEYMPAAGLSTFTVAELTGKVVVSVVRGGLGKGITSTATIDTQYVQVNDNVIILPTGDVTYGELFIFEYR